MGKMKDSTTNWSTEPSCLDSAYERRAIEQGLNEYPVFEENWPENRVDIIGANGPDALAYLAPLTNDQILRINREVWDTLKQEEESYCIKLARAIERAHGIEVKDGD